METYKVFAYDWDNQHLVAENDDREELVAMALEQSAVTHYTYRVETWENEQMVGGWRFFNKGEEFTQQIRDAVSNINLRKWNTMKKCSLQDCAVVCMNCIHFKASGERGICKTFNSPTPVDPYEWCDEFHCKRASK